MDSLRRIEDIQVSRFQNHILKQPNVIDLDLKTLTQTNESSIKNSEATYDQQSPCCNDHEMIYRKISKLKVELDAKCKTILNLEKTLNEHRLVMSDNGISGSATQKIIDLSRKNRDVHSELAKERNKVRRLEQHLSKMKAMENAQNKEQDHSISDPSIEQELKDRISKLEEQLTGYKKKTAEQNNSCQKLKQDLKIAQKAIALEIGENVTIGSLTEGNGWKGRAQQILLLQNKVSELQHHLSQLKKTSVSVGTSKLDEKHRDSVRKIEKENKQRCQDLKIELDKLHSEYDTVQQQYSALRARNKTLTAEIKELKQKLKVNNRSIDSIECPKTGHIEATIDIRYKELQYTIKDLQSRLCNSENERKRLSQTVCKLQSSTLIQPIGENSCIPLIKKISSKQSATTRNSVSAGASVLQRKFLGLEYEEICAKYRVMEIERDRLISLTDFLQKKLDEANDKITTTMSQETRIKDTSVKNSSRSGVSLDSLQESLILQQDENRVLRENLLMSREEIQRERHKFHAILEETRQIFSETVNTIKKSTVDRT